MVSRLTGIKKPAHAEKEMGTAFSTDTMFSGYQDGLVFSYDIGQPRDYQEMLDTDGKAAGIEKLLTFPILSSSWSLERPDNDRGQTDFVWKALSESYAEGANKTPINKVIAQLTSAVTFRRAYFEKVFKVNDDNEIVYDKIAFRPQDTCEMGLEAKSAEYAGFRQMPVIIGNREYKQLNREGWIYIPPEKAFVYVHGSWRDPVEGMSSMQIPYWALAHGSKVQTPYGEVNIEDIEVGDEVYGSNGCPTRVTAVHPQGVRQMYRVRFKDGRTVDCDADHLWGVYKRNGDYDVLSTQQMMDRGVRLQSSDRPKYSVPRTQPVEYEEKSLPLDPYVMGAWLGDGTIRKDANGVGRYAVSLCSTDEFIPEEFGSRLPDGLKLVLSGDRDYYVRPVVSRSSNPMRDALVSMGVNVTQEQRFIPSLYLEGSVKQRLDLLRGLMDTDGTYGHGTGKQSNSSRYITISQRLAEDVQSLVRSLGGTAIVRWKPTRGLYHVELQTLDCPFYMPRKCSMWTEGDRRDNLTITSIEPVDESECRCITVENKDGLFLTNDYVVTHNCWQTKRKIRYLWYQYIETTSLPRTIVSNADPDRARDHARKVATLKSRGVLGLPSDTDIDTLESSGKGADQFVQAMKWLDSEMSQSVLGGFMDLSSQAAEGKGSYALSQDQSRLYLRSRKVVAEDMATQITRQVIAPLVWYNFGRKAEVPKFQFGPMSENNEEQIVDMFTRFVTSRVQPPREFVRQLTQRTAAILELDPVLIGNRLDNAMDGESSELDQMMAGVDQATSMVEKKASDMDPLLEDDGNATQQQQQQQQQQTGSE